MSKRRVEAFSDGVIAILITIMMLEHQWISDILFVVVALTRLIPDRRIESQLRAERV